MSNSVLKHSKTLLELMADPYTEDNEDWIKLKVKLNNDDKARYIINDSTMCTWGKNQLMKCGFGQERYIRDRMRTVATFCLK